MRRARAIRWIRGLLGVERHGQVGDDWPYRLVREPQAEIAPEGSGDGPRTWRAELVDENGGTVGDALAHGVSREDAEAACEAHHARGAARPTCRTCNGGGYVGATHETECPDCDGDAASWGTT